MSPCVFHAMIALEEKKLSYKLEIVPLPIAPAVAAKLAAKAILGKVPILVHDEHWISESIAISEYVAEEFPSSEGFPRLFPSNLVERARARCNASRFGDPTGQARTARGAREPGRGCRSSASARARGRRRRSTTRRTSVSCRA